MKPRQVLGKYLEVYGQGNPITPEAGKKRAPFQNSCAQFLLHKFCQIYEVKIIPNLGTFNQTW